MKAALEHPIGPCSRSSKEHGHVKFLVDQQFGQTYLEKCIYFLKKLENPTNFISNSNFPPKGLPHKMKLGTFRYMFGFPIGKKIGKIIFLVDFSRQSKWQNQHFSKIFCGPPNLYLKKHSLGYQGNCLKKFGFVILIALKNQPEKWSPFFLPIGNQKISRNVPYAILCHRTFWK